MFTAMLDGGRVVQFGGSDSQRVLDGEWWRLLTATFVHVTVLHILINMWCLWNLGFFGEPLLGRSGFISVYLLTGVAGNMLSLAWSVFCAYGVPSSPVLRGRSSALPAYSSFSCRIASLKVDWKELRSLRLQVLLFAVINLACGWAPLLLPYLPHTTLSRLHIDLASISTGRQFGSSRRRAVWVGTGFPALPKMTSGRASYRARQRSTYAVATLILCLIGYALAHNA